MLIAITTTETLQSPHWCSKTYLPAGVRVYLIPATNLPGDAEIKYWAEEHPEYPFSAALQACADGYGIGLRASDVKIID